MDQIKIYCVNCDDEAKFNYNDELYCTECILDKLIEDNIIRVAEYDADIHGNCEEN